MDLDNVDDAFRLSPVQEGLLYHSLTGHGSGVFVTQLRLCLTGAVNSGKLQTAWQTIIDRYATLRTICLWDGLDESLQVVRSAVNLPFEMLDWRGMPPDRLGENLDAWFAEDRRKGLDLSIAPLMRITLIRLGDDTWQMVWTFHHILLDGWSTLLVLRDVFSEYSGRSISTNRDFAYRDFVEYTLGQDSIALSEFWRPRLADVTSPTRLTDRLGPASEGHEVASLRISERQSRQVREFASAHRVTLNTVILGAWARILATHCDSDDVIFGTTLSGRTAALPNIESGVGLFINTLPLRVRMAEVELGEWLRDIQREQQLIQEMEHSPLVDVLRGCGVPQGSELFDSIVVFENYPDISGGAFDEELKGAGVSVSELDYLDQSNYPLALIVIPGAQLELRFIHDCAKYSRAFCKDLLRQLETTLQSFTSRPDTPPGKHAIGHRLIGAPAKDDRSSADGRTLSQIITGHALNHPDQSALRFRGQSLSYAELEVRANRVANTLTAAGISRGDYVGLFMRRGPDFVAGVLGILKSGAAFVPLDPDYPPQHHEYVCQDVPMKRLLVEDGLRDQAGKLGPEILCIGRDSETSGANPIDYSKPDHPAYVIHTSGSQGRRKGVVVTNRNLTFSTLARRAFYSGLPKRFLLLSPVSFDSAMVGLFWTLAEAGTLVLPEPGQERDVERILQLIAAEQISHTLCIPSLYGLLLGVSRHGELAGLDTVVLAGEASSAAIVTQHFASLPTVALVNEYGPTEATVWCVAAHLTPAVVTNSDVPIGRAIPGSQAHILDRWGQPVPVGVEGELYVSGPGVAQGYLGQAELTAERFLPDPFAKAANVRMYRTGDVVWRRPDGEIIYTGRNDDQVKIRGFRVEPNEIAARLAEHPDIAEAVVMLRGIEPAQHETHLSRTFEDMGEVQALALITEIEMLSDEDVARQLTEME